MSRSKTVDAVSLEEHKRQALILMQRVSTTVLHARLRRARLRQGLSVRELAAKAQISKTSIVRLEQGHGSHPMTVVKICAALGLHLSGITEPETQGLSPVALHRHKDDRWYDMTNFGAGPLDNHQRPLKPNERAQLANESGIIPLLFLRSRLEEGKLLPVILELYGSSPMRSHAGEEFVYVLEGDLLLTIADKEYLLAAGESITFWSAEEHSYAPSSTCKSLPVRLLSIRIDEPAKNNPRHSN